MQYLKKTYFFILPTYREGFSKTLLEACSVGNIVLASNVPGCKEIIDHKKTGLLFKPRNTKDLIAAIKLVMSFSDSKLKKLSMNASIKVNKYFSSKKINNQYLKLIENLI